MEKILTQSSKYSCQAQEIMKLLGRKWSLQILRCISRNSVVSFTQIKKELRISQKVLWARLEEFEEMGLIVNKGCTEKGKDFRSLYKLSNRGVQVENFLTNFEI